MSRTLAEVVLRRIRKPRAGRLPGCRRRSSGPRSGERTPPLERRRLNGTRRARARPAAPGTHRPQDRPLPVRTCTRAAAVGKVVRSKRLLLPDSAGDRELTEPGVSNAAGNSRTGSHQTSSANAERTVRPTLASPNQPPTPGQAQLRRDADATDQGAKRCPTPGSVRKWRGCRGSTSSLARSWVSRPGGSCSPCRSSDPRPRGAGRPGAPAPPVGGSGCPPSATRSGSGAPARRSCWATCSPRSRRSVGVVTTRTPGPGRRRAPAAARPGSGPSAPPPRTAW